jgi:hypothetical protein
MGNQRNLSQLGMLFVRKQLSRKDKHLLKRRRRTYGGKINDDD